MNVCPLITHPDWKELVSLIGEKAAYREYMLNGFDLPNPKDYQADINMDGFQFQFEVINDADLKQMQSLGINNTRISQYNPVQADTVYRNFMRRTQMKLVTSPTIQYDKGQVYDGIDGHTFFMDTLRLMGFDVIDIQIVDDFLQSRGENFTVTNTDEIALLMDAIIMDSRRIETHYPASGSYSRSVKSPVEKFYQIGSSLLGPIQWDELIKDFTGRIDALIGDADFINPETGSQYTILELLLKTYDKYVREENRINDIIERFFDMRGEIKDEITFVELQEAYRTIRQDMGVADGLIWKENQYYIQKIAIKLGEKWDQNMRDMHQNKSGMVLDTAQADMSGITFNVTSITDFSDRQLLMQHIGREVSLAQLRTDAEQLQVLTEMENLMRDVLRWHYDYKPKTWVDRFKFWNYSKKQQDVFGWMLDMDADGNYRTVARYEESEKKYRDEVYERAIDKVTGKPTDFFVLSNKKVATRVLAKQKMLRPGELNRFREIMRRYNNYSKYGDQFRNFTNEQRAQAGEDTTFLRNLYIKVNVRSHDSPLFAELKKEAQMYAGTSRGKLAQAKINLYDYLYDKNTELLSQNNNEFHGIERVNLPQVYADFQEEWNRYGFTSAWRNFWDNTHKERDNDTVSFEGNVIVNMNKERTFSNTKKVPYRTLQKKDRISINIPRIFSHHFSTLIFKKHYDEVIPVMDAAQLYYKYREEKGDKFTNIIKFIEDYANQRIFFQKTDFGKSVSAKAIRAFSSLAVTQFLGLAPLTSLINLSVGVSETYKHLIGDYNLDAGSKRFVRGFQRMLGRLDQRDAISFSSIQNGRFTYNKKAMAIMDYYGIETFSTNEIARMGDFIGEVQDVMLTLQKSSEILIRGAAFFSEMSDEQWDAFELNPDGTLRITDSNKIPTELDVAEWKNKIGNVQGKYDDETKRLYQGNAIYQAFFLFKGWLIDYVRNRFVSSYRDQFGVEREGYYKTVYRLANYQRLLSLYKGKDSLTPLEEQNLRKVYYDIIFLISSVLMQGAIDFDDEKESWYVKQLAKINAQIYLFARPTDMVNMLKNPFAGIYHLEMGAKLLESLFTLQIEKAGEQGILLVPGKQIYGPVIDLFDEDNEE
jgi:hypothetical protein